MPIFAETFWRLEGQCQSLRLRQTMKNPHQIESSVDRKLLTKWRWEKSFYLKLKPTNFLRQALKHESNGTTWQIALLSCLFDGELLFVNTRLSVKVKLSVFNLVKAIQSCREEVKIWSKNFEPINVTLVLTVITLSNQEESKARVPNIATYLIFTLLSNERGIDEIEKYSSINVFIKRLFPPQAHFYKFCCKKLLRLQGMTILSRGNFE